jgi:hypothetical protein
MIDNPTESVECKRLAKYLEGLVNYGKVVKYAHLVNELKLNRRKGEKPNFAFLAARKAEGWKAGVPDYIVITKKEMFFIEMKRKKGNKASETQKEWIEAINNVGVKAYICYGYDQAVEVINKSLNL